MGLKCPLGCCHVQMSPVAPAIIRQTDRQTKPHEAEDAWWVYQ